MFAFKNFIVAIAITAVRALSPGALEQITFDFGPNPTNVTMFAYIPTGIAYPTPLIMALHYCTGTGPAYFAGTTLAQLADQHGFIVIYPSAPAVGACWDVNTNATLTHDGGSDSLAIASMVRYATSKWYVNSQLVFATGTSSGAMFTNVLMGAYPDLFAAGSLYSGVPYGCFGGAYAWSVECATGELIETPQQWGDLVRSGYPGFSGIRPKVQFWHGTVDTALYPQNFWEEIKQWTNVFGVSQTPTSNITDDPQSGYSRASYGSNVQAILAQGVGHTVPEHETDTLAWFGLSSLTPSSKPSNGTASHFAQCGGVGFTGPAVCAAPFTCQFSHVFFSQCL